MTSTAPTAAERRSLRQFGSLTGSSLKLAWRADRRLLTATAVLQIANGAVLALQILVIERVLSSIIASQQPGGSLSDTVLPVAALVLVIAFTTVIGAVQTHWQRLLADMVSWRTWGEILDVTSAVSLREYESPQFYDELQRVQTNALGRPYVLTQALIGLISGVTSTVGLAVAVFAISPWLLPLLLISGIPLYLASRMGGKLEFAFAVKQSPRVRLRIYLSGILTGRDEAKEIRAFDTAGAIRERYDDVYGTYITDLRRHVKHRSIIALISSLASSIVLGATMFAIVWLVSDGRLTLASAGAAIVAVRMLAAQIAVTFGSISSIFESGLFLQDLTRFLTGHRAAITVDRAGAPAPATFGRIAVRDLTFAYPGADRPVLDSIDLEIGAGQIVALVGENGSGKTTLAKVMAALYSPDSGTICWDGVDIATYDRQGLRRAIAIIFQDFVRYQLSVEDNIALGRSDLRPVGADVMRAADRSGAARFIAGLPDGYDTVLSKAFGGSELSGGQWQRLALARAFYRDAPFVILDEPSASLDPRAEHELFNSLRSLLQGRTVLFISHRMSTVREADQIYVMSAGRIVETGTHGDLMALDGHYADMFTLQAKAFN